MKGFVSVDGQIVSGSVDLRRKRPEEQEEFRTGCSEGRDGHYFPFCSQRNHYVASLVLYTICFVSFTLTVSFCCTCDGATGMLECCVSSLCRT